MTTNLLRRVGPVLLVCAVWLGGAPWASAEAAKPAPVPLGDGSYQLTREARTAFARATAPLKYEAQGDAAAFCAAQGKRMKLVSVDEDKASVLRGGFSRVTIVFKALRPDDPELAGEPYRAEEAAVLTSEEQSARYLRMLDELHAHGILSDKELKAATKRVKKE